jgi:hypothetical protein
MFFRKTHWLLPMAIGALAALLGTYAALCPNGGINGKALPVQSAVLYRSPQLTGEQLAAEIRRLGIKTVVNLGTHASIDEPVCRELGVDYVEFPIGDVWCLCGQRAPGQIGTPGGPQDLTSLWKRIDDPASQPVLVHCQGGVHRTGVVAAMYRIRYQGWRADDAIAEMDLLGFESHKTKFDNVTAYLRAFEDSVRQAQAVGRPMQRR